MVGSEEGRGVFNVIATAGRHKLVLKSFELLSHPVKQKSNLGGQGYKNLFLFPFSSNDEKKILKLCADLFIGEQAKNNEALKTIYFFLSLSTAFCPPADLTS
jgi:hypothetical protein